MACIDGNQPLRVFLDAYLANLLARTRGLESLPKPAYYYLWVYWHDFAPFAVVALLGLLFHLKGQRNSSIIVSTLLVVTIAFSVIGSKLMAYVVPAFPFISLLAAMAIGRLKNARYAIACAVILFPLYWFTQRGFVELIYGDDLGYKGSINSRNEPLMQLLVRARPHSNDRSPTPLVICMDGFRFYKQQAVFYGDRPVIETFLLVPLSDTESPLEQVVTSRPTPIVIWSDLYPKVASSAKYNFSVIVESGPLTLGEISRP